jgi:flavin reductase (DIM6/NTAB) family NADH-FMN oxidoreductase RutF
MEQSVAGLRKGEIYKLLNCMIVPRPIAWVTTRSEEGVVNLAPFCTFSIICYDPPLLGINMAFKDDGSRKDSARNVIANGELVVHIADDTQVDALHASAFAHPSHVSETTLLGLPLLPGVDIAVPHLRDAPLALECRLSRTIQFGPTSDFIVAEPVRIHSRDGLIQQNRIDSRELRPLSRLAGPVYGTIGPVIVRNPAG